MSFKSLKSIQDSNFDYDLEYVTFIRNNEVNQLNLSYLKDYSNLR